MRWIWLAIAADVAAIVATIVVFEATPVLAVPALAAVLPLLVRSPHAVRRARIASTVLISLFAVAGAMTAGMLFVPAAVLMGVASTRTDGAESVIARS